MVLVESLHPRLALSLVRERHEQVVLNELLVEDEAQHVLLAQLLLFTLIQWLEDEVVERLELFGLILAASEVKQAAVGQAHEALFPATSEHAATLTLLLNDAGLEALDHGVVDDSVSERRIMHLHLVGHHVVSGINLRQLLLERLIVVRHDLTLIAHSFRFELVEDVSFGNLTRLILLSLDRNLVDEELGKLLVSQVNLVGGLLLVLLFLLDLLHFLQALELLGQVNAATTSLSA